MVEIHVKRSEENQFLYRCESNTQVEEIAKDVIEIHNLQSQIQHLVSAFQHRFLNPKGHSDAEIALVRALSEAESYASKDQVPHKRFLSPHVMRDLIGTIEKEALMNQSLGTADFCAQEKLKSDVDLLQEDTAQLWWAGKELKRNKRLSDYIGKNEKTKIVIKLQSIEPSPAC